MASLPHPRSRRDQEGQTSIEYMGMVLVSAAVIAVLLKAAPGIGGDIVSALKDQIDAILGGG